MTHLPDLLNSLAEAKSVEFVRSNECTVMDDFSAHEETYLAGFRVCYAELLPVIEMMREGLINSRMQFADCMSRVKAPDTWMIEDIDKCLAAADKIMGAK